MSSGSGSSTTDKNLGDNNINNTTTTTTTTTTTSETNQEDLVREHTAGNTNKDIVIEELVNFGLASREVIEFVIQALGENSTPDAIANFILEHQDIGEILKHHQQQQQQQQQQQSQDSNTRMGSILSSSTSNQTSSSNHGTLVSRATSLIPNTFGLAFGALGDTAHKMVFVVNMDLNMGKGKQCAQVAHAALGLYLKIQQTGSDQDQYKAYQWLDQGQKKIVLKGNNLQHMKKIQNDADTAKLPCFMVSDAGCTQIAPGSKTVLSIFGTNEDVDKVTGDLKLL